MLNEAMYRCDCAISLPTFCSWTKHLKKKNKGTFQVLKIIELLLTKSLFMMLPT